MQRFIATFLFICLNASFNAIGHEGHRTEVVVDGVQISNVWARAGKPNSAAFMKLFNTTGENRKIVSARTDITERVELHDHIQEGDVMKMRKVDAIEIPAGQVVELKPGGKHVMFFDLKEALKKGQEFKLALVLDNGSVVELQVPVKAMRHKGGYIGSGKGAKSEDCPCPGKQAKDEGCPCPGKEAKEEGCPCPHAGDGCSIEHKAEG